MSPRFQFLTSSSPNAVNEQSSAQSLLAEVIRCHSYYDETVLNNTFKILDTPTTGNRADGVRLAKMRYIAIVYHAANDVKIRESLKDLARTTEKCKIPMLRKEQDLFLNSMEKADLLPTLTKFMYTSDLVLCYFRRELEMNNWNNIKLLLNLHPKLIPLYEHLEVFLKVGKHQMIASAEVLEVFVEYVLTQNKYFMEHSDFESVFQKVINSCSLNISEEIFDQKLFKKSFITTQNANILKKRIDEYVNGLKEGFVKTKEYKQVVEKVAEWIKKKKMKNGRNVAVVDALNFGLGRDPHGWKSISDQFEHVFFATRLPPKDIRECVFKRYGENVLYCDKLSADDLLILRMALEFGPLTSLVTNDRYRDHRQQICNGDSRLEAIWDDFLVDSVYRHFDGRIEERRNFNLRIRKIDGRWFVPVLDSEGYSEEFRRIRLFCIDQQKKLKNG